MVTSKGSLLSESEWTGGTVPMTYFPGKNTFLSTLCKCTFLSWVHTFYIQLDSHPGARLPYKKDGVARRKFWNETLRGTKILFCGRGLKFFSPLRGTCSKTTQYLLLYYFRLITGTAKASAVDISRLNALRGTPAAAAARRAPGPAHVKPLFTPKRHNEHLRPF